MLRSNLVNPYHFHVMVFLLAILCTFINRKQRFAGKCRLKFYGGEN